MLKFKSNLFKDYIRNTTMMYAIGLVLLIFVLFIGSVNFIYKNTIVRTNQSYNQKVSRFIESEFNQYEADFAMLEEAAPMKRIFQDKGDVLEVNRILYHYVNHRNMRASFVLLDNESRILATNLYEGNQEILINSPFLQTVLKKLDANHSEAASMLNKAPFLEAQSSQYLIAKALMADGQLNGYLLFFVNDIGQYVSNKDVDMLAIADRFDNVIYSSSQFLVNSMGKINIQKNGRDTAVADGDRYYLTDSQIQNAHIHILTLTSMSAYRQSLFTGFIVLLCLSLLIMLLIFAVAPMLVKRHLQSFDSLIEAVNECKEGNIGYRIETRTFDEFQTIYDDFNHMVSRIQTLIKHNDEIAEKKRKMEIKHLENQFNPHFVFNVLEMLRYEIMFDAQNASNIIVMFANLMRYNINYGNMEISLQTDINYLKDYLQLQKMRFNKRLDYQITIEPGLEHCMLPKLLIQPIIENSIKHSMEQTNHLSIRIKIERHEDDMAIVIEDDGPGIEEERLAYLQTILDDKEAEPEHIGLYNAHRIVQLLYGEQYGLSIASKCGAGTKIVIKIPVVGDARHV